MKSVCRIYQVAPEYINVGAGGENRTSHCFSVLGLQTRLLENRGLGHYFHVGTKHCVQCTTFHPLLLCISLCTHRNTTLAFRPQTSLLCTLMHKAGSWWVRYGWWIYCSRAQCTVALPIGQMEVLMWVIFGVFVLHSKQFDCKSCL